MALTEKEMVEKICWRTIDSSNDTCDAHGNILGIGKCFASRCTAWRWMPITCCREASPPTPCEGCAGRGSVPAAVGEIDEGLLGPCPECEGSGVRHHFERTGYCGLAGRPEVA